MKRLIVLLTISLLINIVGISAFFYVSAKKGGITHLLKATVAQPVADPLRVGLFKTYNTENKIVFIGDSITQNAEWAELLNRTDVVNRGITGDTTKGLINRIGDLKLPAKVFIMIGINDLMKSIPVEEIFNNYKEIVSKLQAQSPKTEIYIQETLPINYSKQGNKIDNKDVEKLNKLIGGIKSVTIIDTSNLVDNGQLKSEYSEDGLHPNAQGYQKWKENIMPYI